MQNKSHWAEEQEKKAMRRGVVGMLLIVNVGVYFVILIPQLLDLIIK